jgi:hypothetical protein
MRNFYIQPADAENDVLACAAFVAERVGSNDAHAEAIREVVARYLKKGEVDLSAELADAVEDNFARDRLLGDVAEYCARIDDDEYAVQLADACEDINARAAARERIVAAKAEMHQFDKALEIADSLSHRDNAYAAIAFQHAAQGSNVAADALIDKIEFPALKAKTYAEIGADRINNDKRIEAEGYINTAESIAKEIEHSEEYLREMCELAALWIAAGRRDRAIELLSATRARADAIDNRGWRDYWLSQIAQLYFRADTTELADRALDQIEDPYHFALCLKKFAERKAAHGNQTEALEDLEEGRALLLSQRDIDVRDSKARYELLSAIAVDVAACGKPELGIEYAAAIREPTTRNAALNGIAGVCAMTGHDEFAQAALRAIDDDGIRSFALIGMSDAYKRMDKNDEALNTLTESHNIVEELPQLPARAAALCELAVRFDAAGSREQARAAMLENLRINDRILDSGTKAIGLVRAADVFEKLELEIGDAEKSVLKKLVGVLVH